MLIQFAQKPNDLSNATQSSSARSSPSSSPSSTSSSSCSSSVVAILSGHSAISVSGVHATAAPAAASSAATISSSVLHHHLTNHTKCAKMTEEGETTAQIRNGLNNGAGSTSAGVGGGTLLHSGFRYAVGGRTTSPSSGRRSAATTGGSSQSKLDLSQKSKSANDLLLDVVGGGDDDHVVEDRPKGFGASAANATSTTGSGGGGGGTGGVRSPLNHGPILGGRLQFFKDGKFILELATSGDGDRSGWVSVPQKTYWPPMAAPTTTNGFGILPQKNESSTSISFSDDNSSVQSSPWQRDHSWKQTNPRKNISAEMALYYQRPIGSVLSKHLNKTARKRRRRPHMIPPDFDELFSSQTNCPETPARVDEQSDHLDTVDGKTDIPSDSTAPAGQSLPNQTESSAPSSDAMACEGNASDAESTLKSEAAERSASSPAPLSKNQHSDSMDFIDVETIKSEPTERPIDSDEPSSNKSESDAKKSVDCKDSPTSTTPLLVRRTAARNTKCTNRRKLQDVLQQLIDRIPKDSSPVAVRGSSGNAVTHLSAASARMEMHQHQHVSPRKRILRELEKVSLEDHQQTTKRSRPKTNSNHSSAASPATLASRSPPNIYMSSTKTSHMSNGIHQHSSLINGNHHLDSLSSAPVATPITQATSRPISSYSITSLLGHNTHNSLNTSASPHISSSHPTTHHHHPSTDPPSSDFHRTTPSSPKSPASNHYLHQNQSKPPAPGSAFSATKKKSPSYTAGSTCLSPVIGANAHTIARSPSLNSPINYGGRTRSPDLSPSPEQTYSRYRQAPYSLATTSASSPNSSSHYHHPYLPSSSSRASPSGALSPPTDASASQQRYRYGSPISNAYQSQPTQPANNSSPMSFSSRYSPSGSYSQVSPQHYGTKQPMLASPTFNSHSSSSVNSQTPRARDPSPNGMPPRSDLSRESTASSSYAGSAGNGNNTPRTVPKKTAALRHAYTSPTSSPSHGDSTRNGDYYKTSLKEDSPSMRKSLDPTAPTSNRSRSPTPAELQRIYEKELSLHSLGGTASLAGLTELEMNAGLIRAGFVPPQSALQQQQHLHQQQAAAAAMANMYRGMYMMPPNAAAAAGFLQPVYYPSMGFPGAYRNASWMHQPYAALQHPSARFAPNPLLAAAAAYQQSGGVTSLPHSLVPPPASHTAPGVLPAQGAAVHQSIGGGHHSVGQTTSHLHHMGWSATSGAGRHAGSSMVDDDEPVSLVKNEPSSDVPLNLSKH